MEFASNFDSHVDEKFKCIHSTEYTQNNFDPPRLPALYEKFGLPLPP